MNGTAWIAFFQRIPVAQHNNLVLLTTTGTEMILQSIVLLEEEYAVLRGRTAGSQDAGRVLMVPYSKIDYVGFQKKLLEPEVQAIFGDSPTAGALPTAAAGQPVALADSPSAEGSAAETAPEATPAVDQPTPKPQAQPSKSVLLARLRARLSKDSKPAAK